MYKAIFLLFAVLLLITSCNTSGEFQSTQSSQNNTKTDGKPYEIGTVDTAFKLIGPDHKIEVWAVPDPKVSWVTCFYSRAKRGGISWGLGIAEDTSDASVSCRQTGKIHFIAPIDHSEEIWNESTSFFFKKLRIVRFYDKNTNALIYLVYSEKLVDGSPKNSISAVALEDVQPMLK
jgi:CreA protein